MAKLISVTSDGVEYWLNSLQIRSFHAAAKGTLIEFRDGATLAVDMAPAALAGRLNAVIDTVSAWMQAPASSAAPPKTAPPKTAPPKTALPKTAPSKAAPSKTTSTKSGGSGSAR